MIKERVYNRLKDLAGGRVHFNRAPQKPVFPYVVYNLVSSVEEYSDDGHDGLGEYRIQINVWGKEKDRAGVDSLMEQVKATMRLSGDDFDVTGETSLDDQIEDETDYQGAGVDFMCWLKS
jgi:hypothetical protein